MLKAMPRQAKKTLKKAKKIEATKPLTVHGGFSRTK
jgi:hypothetical protein